VDRAAVLGRTGGDLRDWIADLLGATGGALLSWYLPRLPKG
jgi:hypothetical protein